MLGMTCGRRLASLLYMCPTAPYSNTFEVLLIELPMQVYGSVILAYKYNLATNPKRQLGLGNFNAKSLVLLECWSYQSDCNMQLHNCHDHSILDILFLLVLYCWRCEMNKEYCFCFVFAKTSCMIDVSSLLWIRPRTGTQQTIWNIHRPGISMCIWRYIYFAHYIPLCKLVSIQILQLRSGTTRLLASCMYMDIICGRKRVQDRRQITWLKW